ENMAAKNTVPLTTAQTARALANSGVETGKMKGLLSLVSELQSARPGDWRVVVFTRRKETQEAIGRVFEERGIRCVFIRGADTMRNQLAQQQFKAQPPKAHVLISTDAGSEGINLQVCNVVVNFDLSWNPMVVEQRIGRVQRLQSSHAHVVIW